MAKMSEKPEFTDLVTVALQTSIEGNLTEEIALLLIDNGARPDEALKNALINNPQVVNKEKVGILVKLDFDFKKAIASARESLQKKDKPKNQEEYEPRHQELEEVNEIKEVKTNIDEKENKDGEDKKD
jgi:hypothetical protein